MTTEKELRKRIDDGTYPHNQTTTDADLSEAQLLGITETKAKVKEVIGKWIDKKLDIKDGEDNYDGFLCEEEDLEELKTAIDKI